MSTDTFCFPPHEGLPDLVDPSKWGIPPTPNGYIEPDIGITTPEIETGWTRSGRITYVGDSAIPQMVFQGLKHNVQPYLFLSFMVRFDTSFSTNDRIILVFHPTLTSTTSNEHRRIDIRPLTDSTGAGTFGYTPDPDDITSTPDAIPYTVRTNRPSQGENYWKYNTSTNQWDSMPAISNITIRVRSWTVASLTSGANKNWSVEIKIPTTKNAVGGAGGGGANWIDLDPNGFGFYFNVIRLCSGPDCSSHLGGPSCTEYTWPRANYSTGQGLIVDPSTGPIAIEQHLTTGTNAPSEANWPTWLGQGIVGTSSACRGVKFVSGASSIGVVDALNPSGPLGSSIDARNISPVPVNTFAARIINEGTTSADLVSATFRIARWGIGPGGHADWAKIPINIGDPPPPPPPPPINPLGNNNPTVPTDSTAPGHSIGPGASAELQMKWGLSAADRALWAGHGADQCLWVLLDSGGPTGGSGSPPVGVNFTESSVRRNLSFVGLSAQDREAEISGIWQPAPPPGSNHEFLILVSERLLVSTSYTRGITGRVVKSPGVQVIGDDRTHIDDRWYLTWEKILSGLSEGVARWLLEAGNDETRSTWIIINNAYRKTENVLTFDGTAHRVYEPAGSFGYAAQHIGEVNGWKYDITGGPELTALTAGSSYTVSVPNNGAVSIRTRLEAIEPWLDRQGCLKWLLFIPLTIIRLIRKLLNLP